jgi:hypothetical protein
LIAHNRNHMTSGVLLMRVAIEDLNTLVEKWQATKIASAL